MADRTTVKKDSQKSTSKAFSDQEKSAMRERIKEQKRATDKAAGESDALAKIAEMTGQDRVLGKRIHAIIKTNAPELWATTWYGMPAYAKDGKVVCFFKTAKKFNTRYATLGFSDTAKLDEGAMWPTEFALKELTGADEARITSLIKKAVS